MEYQCGVQSCLEQVERRGNFVVNINNQIDSYFFFRKYQSLAINSHGRGFVVGINCSQSWAQHEATLGILAEFDGPNLARRWKAGFRNQGVRSETRKVSGRV